MVRPCKLYNARMKSFNITPRHIGALEAFGRAYRVDGMSAQLRAVLDIVAKVHEVDADGFVETEYQDLSGFKMPAAANSEA